MERVRKKVLLVDDEPMLIRALAMGLEEENDLFDVLTAASGEAALAILEENDIAVLVTDVMMPGIDGVELLGVVRSRYPGVDVVVMTGHGSEAIRNRVEAGGCSLYMEKPFMVSDLRRCIGSMVEKKNEGFAGVLKNIPLPDLIQMCCVSGTSSAIRVRMGGQEGTLHIERGEIIHAVCGKTMGEEAFCQVLGWESGSFETLGPVHVDYPTIERNWQYLLMEAARRRDEAAHQAEDEVSEEKGPRRLLIVDDSAVMRSVLCSLFEGDDRVEVVAMARDGGEALRLLDEVRPDVITLDVNMPVMDGGTALKHIMIKSPCPVVIISNVGSHSHDNILDFLRLGAVDFLSKPGRVEDMGLQRKIIADRVVSAADAVTENFSRVRVPGKREGQKTGEEKRTSCKNLVVALSGQGGHAELMKLLAGSPPMEESSLVALQIMPETFVSPFAGYLDERSAMHVMPLDNGARLLGGAAYLGRIQRPPALEAHPGGGYGLSLREESPEGKGVMGFLLEAAREFGENLTILLFSGAQADGLDGLGPILEMGGRVWAQPEETCMLPEPVREAVSSGVAGAGTPLTEIIGSLAQGPRSGE